MISQIDHIGIAVNDLGKAKESFAKSIGASNFQEERVESQLVDVASFYVGEVKIELLQAYDENSPIAKYISKKGEGIHHIAFRSNDIKGDLESAKNQGIDLINDEPFQGAHDMLVAFLHPKSTNKVLTELCQKK
ncbi:MAG: methylmalonyl-CoA epimerase [Candidatus Kapaibacteriales bacterium]